jgi:hypothetical protein
VEGSEERVSEERRERLNVVEVTKKGRVEKGEGEQEGRSVYRLDEED